MPFLISVCKGRVEKYEVSELNTFTTVNGEKTAIVIVFVFVVIYNRDGPLLYYRGPLCFQTPEGNNCTVQAGFLTATSHTLL